MSKRRVVTLAVAMALSTGPYVPQSARGSRLPNEPAEVSPPIQPAGPTVSATAAPETPEPTPSAAPSAAAPRQEKRKGNGFVRALTAPFRALAKLFGGGKSESAKKQKQSPAPQAEVAQAKPAGEASAPVEPAGRQQPEAATPAEQAPDAAQPADAVAPQPIVTDAPSVVAPAVGVPPASAAPPASEGTRIVRPDAGGVAEAAKPKMWIPVIGGVPRDPLSQGRALLQHGYIQEAIAELSVAAATADSNIVEANNLLGLAYDRMGWHLQAIECYKRALTVAPKDPVILANLGYSLYLANDPGSAVKYMRQAVRLAPDTPVIHNNLGIALATLGRHDDAFKSFARASNKYDAHLKLAGILETQKRDRDALKHYEAALRLQPGTSAVIERMVALYERTGQRDKAETARRALGRPANPQRTNTGGG